jgi:hypothetical protein
VPAKRKERIMVQLSLEAREKEILIWALRSAVSDLGAEIADTEKQEFREDLKERKAVLQNVLQRLG